MKQLTCEMCGSTNLLKQDGVFVCQDCGTKYSVEEAKKMMVEGTVEVTGTVKVDNTDKIENYLRMAQSARDSSNNKEAEDYCNRIIEMDVNNYHAWLLKGQAAGWQSSLRNLRIDEAVNCFEKAIANAPGDVVNVVAEIASATVYSLILAVNKLRLDNLKSYPSQKGWTDYLANYSDFIFTPSQISTALKNRVDELNSGKDEAEQIAAVELSNPNPLEESNARFYTASSIWTVAYTEYIADGDGFPSDYALDRMKEKGAVAYSMMDGLATSKTLKNTPEGIRLAIEACDQSVLMHEGYRDLDSWEHDFSVSSTYMRRKRSLTDWSKKQHNDKISEMKSIRETLEAELKAQMAEKAQKYWEAHPDEKAALEQEKKELESACAPMREQISALQDAVTKINDEIQSLTDKKKSLGLFKGKEKAAIQAQIDELQSKLQAAEEKRDSETKTLEASIADKVKRMAQIDKTLEEPPVKD